MAISAPSAAAGRRRVAPTFRSRGNSWPSRSRFLSARAPEVQGDVERVRGVDELPARPQGPPALRPGRPQVAVEGSGAPGHAHEARGLWSSAWASKAAMTPPSPPGAATRGRRLRSLDEFAQPGDVGERPAVGLPPALRAPEPRPRAGGLPPTRRAGRIYCCSDPGISSSARAVASLPT